MENEQVTSTTTETTGTVSEPAAPVSFADAVEPLKAQESATAQPGAATTAQAAATTEQASSASKQGPIPFDVHKTALDNARTKAREEIETQYQWAKDLVGLPEHERTNLLTWHRTLTSDPVTAVTQLIEALQSDPRYAPQLRSHAARTLAAARGQQEQAADPEPAFMVETGDGRVAFDPDAFAKWRDWNNRHVAASIRQEFSKELQPVQQVAQTFQQREQAAAYTHSVASVIARMKAADPVFDAHKKDVAALIQSDSRLRELALGTDQSAPDPELAIELAWSRVHREKVLPTLSSKERAAVLASLNEKGSAGSINPGHTTTAQPRTSDGRFTPEVVAAHFAAMG